MEDLRNTPSGAIDAASEPNETHGCLICFLTFRSSIGNMGVMIFSEKMLPPRKHELLIPGPQAHWAKLAFEKYYLWKMKNGYVSMP